MATKTIYHFAEGEDPTLDWTEEVEVPDEEIEPTNPTIDPDTIAQVKAQLAKATTVTGVKNALGPLLDALS